MVRLNVKKREKINRLRKKVALRYTIHPVNADMAQLNLLESAAYTVEQQARETAPKTIPFADKLAKVLP